MRHRRWTGSAAEDKNDGRHLTRNQPPRSIAGPTMSYDLRTIAFAAEILYPPQQLRADLVQGVHNTLYRQPAIGYQNYQVAPDGILLSNLPLAPGQISSATFAWDRLALREELRGGSVEDFATRVVNVTQTAFQALSIPTTLMQQFVVRSLIAPRHFRDGREFLGKRLVAPGTEAWQSFGRPLHSLGVRLCSRRSRRNARPSRCASRRGRRTHAPCGSRTRVAFRRRPPRRTPPSWPTCCSARTVG
jgi:hypothetical protein